jgi:hypothetical protein
MSEPTTNPTSQATTGTDGVDLRVGDRITVQPGKARSAHTRAVLTRDFAIDVTSLRLDFDGAIEVTGVVLTHPRRLAGRHTDPQRDPDPRDIHHTNPGRRHRHPPGHRRNAGSDRGPRTLRWHRRGGPVVGGGDTATGVNLLDLIHLDRPAAVPAVQACKRRHEPQRRCRRCADARQPVVTWCEGPLCRQVAEDLVVFRPPSRVAIVRALCPTHRDAFTTRDHSSRNEDTPIEVFPLADGTHTYFMHGDGTEIATCKHCGRVIYLYAALRGRREPWREGVCDETDRCGPAEDGHRIRMVHEPAVTLAERDYARTAASCGTSADLHPLAECPARRS